MTKPPVFLRYLFFNPKGEKTMSDEPQVFTLSKCRACRTGEGKLKSFPNLPNQKAYVIQCVQCGASTEPCATAEIACETWNYRPNPARK